MRATMAERSLAGDNHFSHFGPEANLLTELEGLFREYGESGRGKSRHYVHDDAEAKLYGSTGNFHRMGRSAAGQRSALL